MRNLLCKVEIRNIEKYNKSITKKRRYLQLYIFYYSYLYNKNNCLQNLLIKL